MKLLVKPTADHGYLDPNTGNEVQPFRPSVINSSVYITSLFAAGKLEMLAADLSEDATDEEFAKFHKDSDRDAELSVQAFVSKFGKDAKVEKAEGKAPNKAEAKAAAEAEAKGKAEAEAKAKVEAEQPKE